MKITPIGQTNYNQQNTAKTNTSFGMKVIMDTEGFDSLLKVINGKRASDESQIIAYNEIYAAVQKLTPERLDKIVLKKMKKMGFPKEEMPSDVIPNYKDRTAEVSFFETLKNRYSTPTTELSTVVKDLEFTGKDSFTPSDYKDAPLLHFMPKSPFNRPSSVEKSLIKATEDFIGKILNATDKHRQLAS